MSMLYILLRRHEVNDLLLLCNRNSILNKTIERKRIKTTCYFDGVYFSARGNAYTRDDTTYFDVVQLLLAEVCCVCFPRANGKPNVLIRLSIERFTHKSI